MSDNLQESPDTLYSIPDRYRKMENLHIVFWIIKDISWCMGWAYLAVGMIIPTLVIAISISWRTRHIASELAHNLAVTFWICANSTWMIMEFLKRDEHIYFDLLTGKQFSLIPFAIGSLILINYYLIQRPKELRKKRTAPL